MPEFEADVLHAVQQSGTAVPANLDAVAADCADTELACKVEVACYTVMNFGGRHGNEDRVITARGVHGELPFHTIGVLDGHDTAQASDAVAKLLPATLAKHLKGGEPMEQAFCSTMEECEESLKKLVETAGTCVCSCTVAGRHVWCANLGDCRAALVLLQVPESAAGPTKALRLCWMSRDQKASSPDEVARIRAAGGRVSNGRVEGLEPSRTLGDFDVKLAVPPDVISIVPEVRCVTLGDGRVPAQAIVVVATDGVWDVISGQDICDLIHARKELAALQTSMLRDGPRADSQPLRDLAQDLVQFAVARGSEDDCTAVAGMISVAPQTFR